MKVLFITDVGDETGIGGHVYSVPARDALACRRHRRAFAAGRLRRCPRRRNTGD